MEGLKELHQQLSGDAGSNGASPAFPTISSRRRIVSEPADSFFLISSELLETTQESSPACIPEQCLSSSDGHQTNQQHNFFLSATSPEAVGILNADDSQFGPGSDFLAEKFDIDSQGSKSPPLNQFSLTTAASTQSTHPPSLNVIGSTKPICGECDKLFSRPEKLRQHMLLKHNSGIPIEHECDQCGKAFSTKPQLTRHLKSHLEKEPARGTSLFECDKADCNRTYNTYSSLAKHRKSHDSGDQVSSPASAASSSSPSTGSTPAKRGHKEQGEKRFQCPQCPKRFPTSKDLKRHDVVHTGNREFQCSFCSHRFGRKDHRMRHEKKTHAAELQQQQLQLQQQSKQVSPPPLVPLTQSTAPPPPPLTNSTAKVGEISRSKRWRHMSSPSTFRHLPVTTVPSTTTATAPFGPLLFSNVNVKHQMKIEPDMISSNTGTVEVIQKQPLASVSTERDIDQTLGLKLGLPIAANDNIRQLITTEATPNGILLASQDSHRLYRVIHNDEDVVMDGPCASDQTNSADMTTIDNLLSEMMQDSPMGLSDITHPGTSGEQGTELSASMPSSSSILSLSATSTINNAPQKPAPFQTSKLGGPFIFETSMTSATSSPSLALPGVKASPKLTGDLFTRTKNPVLPSIYIDNSLIVPEPTKQKYHSPHQSLMFESDLMELDSFIKSGSTTGDGKEISESIFNM